MPVVLIYIPQNVICIYIILDTAMNKYMPIRLLIWRQIANLSCIVCLFSLIRLMDLLVLDLLQIITLSMLSTLTLSSAVVAPIKVFVQRAILSKTNVLMQISKALFSGFFIHSICSPKNIFAGSILLKYTVMICVYLAVCFFAF